MLRNYTSTWLIASVVLCASMLSTPGSRAAVVEGNFEILTSLDDIDPNVAYYFAAFHNELYIMPDTANKAKGGFINATSNAHLLPSVGTLKFEQLSDGGYSLYFNDGTLSGYINTNSGSTNEIDLVTSSPHSWSVSCDDGRHFVFGITDSGNNPRKFAYNAGNQ